MTLDEQPGAELAEALGEFEKRFRYPLGQGRSFWISHGSDYTRFFRAIGQARCFVARRGDEIAGVVSVARCPLRLTSGEVIDASFIADLKLAKPSDGWTLVRLLREAVPWARVTNQTPGFSVVMGGTARNPTQYTGRLGIPAYEKLAEITILRIPSDLLPSTQPWQAITPNEAAARHVELTPGHFATQGGNHVLRSQVQPHGLLLTSGKACGILEDTRQCKRLFLDDGEELVSAHLSSFGFEDSEDAIQLLAVASAVCREHGIPAFFVSVPSVNCNEILGKLRQDDLMIAPATVYGFGLAPDQRWSVNTAEV